MGYNAGGYGAMTFPSIAARDAWRASMVSHAAYDDWIEELAGAYLPDQTVKQRLAALAKANDPKRYALYEIAVDDARVSLTFDVNEDEFRDCAGDIAAMLRAATPHGAAGTFCFLGTAGAEGDFAYALELGRETSRVKVLSPKKVAAVYESPAYRAFVERATTLLTAGNPTFRKAMKKVEANAVKPPVSPTTLDGILEVFLLPKPGISKLAAAAQALGTVVHPQLEKRLVAVLRELGKGSSQPTQVSRGGLLVQAVAQRRDLHGLAPALAAYAISNADPGGRAAAAELVVAWGDITAMTTLGKRIGEDSEVGSTAATALLRVDPAAALALAQRLARARKANAKGDRAVYNLIQALEADLEAAKKHALLVREPNWNALLVGLLDHADRRTDPYLAYNALTLLAAVPRDPKLTERVEALLAGGGLDPSVVIAALKRMRSTKWRAIAKQRLATSTDADERESIAMNL